MNIDECESNPCLNNGICKENEICTNMEHGISCFCGLGFETDMNTSECVDVDECADGACSANAECTNTHGGFSCNCNIGFAGDGHVCEDIDECATEGACPVNSDCENSVGGFSCKPHDGFEAVMVDGVLHIIDINECETGDNNCHSTGVCTNVEGSFECSCPEGSEGDGLDICLRDECADGSNTCGANTVCTDTDMAFT